MLFASLNDVHQCEFSVDLLSHTPNILSAAYGNGRVLHERCSNFFPVPGKTGGITKAK